MIVTVNRKLTPIKSMVETDEVLFTFYGIKACIFVSIKHNLWKKCYKNQFNSFGFLMITETNNLSSIIKTKSKLI